MSYVREQWERLLHDLNSWGSAVEVAPGRIALTYEPAEGPARQHPEGIGTWLVLDADGNVLDEFGSEPG